MTDLTIFVPTRGRPENACLVQDVFLQTCKGNTEAIFIISEDDERLEDYVACNRLGFLNKILPVQPKRRGMAEPLNLGFQKWFNNPRTFPSYAVGFMGDDHMPRTQGWDTAYLEALTALSGRCRDRLKPGVGMVYGNDLLQGENLPTQVAMTTNIPARLGRMLPYELAHLYTDNYWLELGKQLNRLRYLPEVIIEHMHPGAGKAKVDKGYEYSGNFALDLADKYAFEEIVKKIILPRDVDHLKRLI